MSQRFLSPADVSSRYSPLLSPTKLERLRRSGSGPRFRKCGGRVYYTAEDIERYLSSILHGTSDDPAPRSGHE